MHKKQEREIHSQEEKRWAETDSEWRQTIDLAEKSLQKNTTNVSKEGEIILLLRQQIEKINRKKNGSYKKQPNGNSRDKNYNHRNENFIR